MNAEIKKFEAEKTPFSLINISYRNERDIQQNEGPRMFAQARELLLENLRSTIRKDDLVVKGQNYDFALLKGTPPDELRTGLDELRSEITATLRVDVGPDFDIYGPEDFH